MILQNFYLYGSSIFLFNEKLCFNKKIFNDVYLIKNSLMRFDLELNFPYDLHLVSFCLLSCNIPSDFISLVRTNSNCIIHYKLGKSIFIFFNFFFFSFFQQHSESRFFYWSNSYSNFYNNAIHIYYKSKHIHSFGFYDHYFSGFLDANYLYYINMSFQYKWLNNVIFLRLFQSLFSIPFLNKIEKK